MNRDEVTEDLIRRPGFLSSDPRNVVLVFAVIGLMIGAGIFSLYQRVIAPAKKRTDAAQRETTASTVALEAIEAARQATWKWTDERINRHEVIVSDARKTLETDVVGFLEKRKSHIDEFVDEVTGFRSQWTAVTDHDEHVKNVERCFRTHVLSDKDFADGIRAAIGRFNATVAADETAMYGDFRAQISRNPALSAKPFASEQLYHDLLGRALIDAEKQLHTNAICSTLAITVAGGVAVTLMLATSEVSTISGFLISQVSEFATAYVVMLVGAIVKSVTEVFGGSDQEIRDATRKSIDTITQGLLHGSDDAKLDYEALKRIADKDTNDAIRERSAALMLHMEASGHLGILHAIQLLNRRAETIRREAMKKIVWEEIQ